MDKVVSSETNGKALFERFRRAAARLHEPLSARSPIELVHTKVNSVELGRSEISDRLFDEEDVQEHARAKSADSKPSKSIKGKATGLTIKPSAIKTLIAPFGDQYFETNAPGANEVDLVIQDLGSNQFQAVSMEQHDSHVFSARVGFLNGRYLIGFRFDGITRPDPVRGQRLIMNHDGIFTPKTLVEPFSMLSLSNETSKQRQLSLESNQQWILPETTTLTLAARESAKIRIHFDVSTLEAGPNEGLLYVNIQDEDKTTVAGVIHVSVQLEVGGAIGEFSFSPRAFGEIRQGLDNLQLEVEVQAHGRGPLNGIISLPQSDELVDFHLNADDDATSRLSHTFHINSANLTLPQPHSTEAALRVRVRTDSFLANHRVCRFEIPYRLIYLKKSLPALSFGTIRPGATKTMRLQIKRSDAREIELAVALPPGANKFLEAYPAHSDVYIFRLDASQLSPGAQVDETIELMDRKSGLRDHIKLLAAITQSVPTDTVDRLATS